MRIIEVNVKNSYVQERGIMNKLIIKVIAWIPAILMAFTIFGFSTQTGNESSGVSEKAARVIVNIVDSTHRFSMDEAYKVQLIEDLQFPIRKGAHMAEYDIYAMCGIGIMCMAD